jgi:putative ABC transport system substrate-binding protein
LVVVFTSSGDPVANGLVASLARPAGNLTGISVLTTDLHPKRFELIYEMVPQAPVIALLANPNAPSTERMIHEVVAAAKAKDILRSGLPPTGGITPS